MILISVGTIDKPFNRLIDICLDIFKNTKHKVLIQAGSTCIKKVPSNRFIVKNIMTYQEILQAYKKADLIISAAGEGSVISLLQHSKNKPILFPRLKKYHEHVDDQQLQIAKKMKKKNYVLMATNKKNLLKLAISRRLPMPTYSQSSLNKDRLVKNLIKETASLIS